jgi:type VI secretion system secreted protein VgrG
MVVGPQGEEIYTDEFGRVKVQFFWDREGKRDDKSSCWIRVIQPWAGGNWGAIRIPRIGQEVVVDFLEGTPDRPIITGSVYNADQMPPYGLPDNKTQSGVKSRSSLQGEASNFNELRFEDKKGQEDVYLHAEKDMNVVVENDRTEDVGHDETISIGHDRTESVGNDEKLEIKSNRTDSVGKNETRSVGDNRTREVGKDEEVSIGQNRKVAVEQDESRTIGGSQEVSVGKNRTVQVGKELVIDAGDSIILKTGAARIQMKSDGSILIQGKDLTLKASGKIVGQAASEVILKGSKIINN